MTIRFSRFPSTYSTAPEPVVVDDWDGLVDYIGHHKPYTDKGAAPLISPAVYPPGKVRAAGSVETLGFGAFDLDGVSDDAVIAIIDRFESNGIAALFLSSWSHGTKKGNCLRVFFPFSRPVAAAEWSDVWARAFQALALGKADPACKDAARIYYVPSHPDIPSVDPLWYELPGTALNIDELLAEDPSDVPDDFREPLPIEAVRDWVESMGREKARPWKRVLDEKPIAQEGKRNVVLYGLSRDVLRKFPYSSTDSVVAFFEPSLRAAGTCAEDENLASRVDAFRDEFLQERAAERMQAANLQQQRLAFVNRDKPYTREELQQWRNEQGGKIFWILAHHGFYWFFVNGAYRDIPASSDIAAAMATKYFSPNPAIECEKVGAQGQMVGKTFAELLADYGTTVNAVERTWEREGSRLEDRGDMQVLVLGTRRRAKKSKHSPRVARWLELLPANQTDHEKLLNWLAEVPKTMEPLSALSLWGPPGVGKSLLAYGVSAIWTDNEPGSRAVFTTRKTGVLKRTPIVLVDEGWRGIRDPLSAVREGISARTHEVDEKWKAVETITGCMRLIIATNDGNAIPIGRNDHVDNDSLDAVTERLFDCRTSHAARQYLDGLEADGQKILPDEIAAHVLWLEESREVERDGRFGVRTQNNEMLDRMVTGSGFRNTMCEWLCNFIVSPGKLPTKPAPVRFHDGTILANSRLVQLAWDTYKLDKYDSTPNTNEVAKTLSALAGKVKTRIGGRNSADRTNYWKIDARRLIAWAQNADFDPDIIERNLANGTHLAVEK